MINRSDIFTTRAVAPNAHHAAANPRLHAAMTMMYRSLKSDAFHHPLPGKHHGLPHGQASHAGLSPAKKFSPVSTAAHVHSAKAQKSASTTVDTAALAHNITAAIKAGGGDETSKSLHPSVAGTQTPLQRLLFKAVSALPPAVLATRPALLAAVQAGFQTQGGRQLALAANILDASLVGDISRPVATADTAPPRRMLGLATTVT